MPSPPPPPPAPYPGDALLPFPAMIYSHRRLIRAAPSAVWPWVVQLGKARGGWYLPRRWERLLPRAWRGARRLHGEWQVLRVGDRVPDYGFGGEGVDVFEVVVVEPGRALVFRSERYGCVFTWALLLEPVGEGEGEEGTVLHLRFRGQIRATGWKRTMLVWGGGWMDYLTTAPMMAGLAERAEKAR